MAEHSAGLTAEPSANNMAEGSSNTPAEDLPQCVIASSNRFNDIGPYGLYLFNGSPLRYGQIFPWDFPQNATQAEEEAFLRNWFGPTTVHMQGYRFLKQVWYCLALWNFEERVPLVEKWYWDQPDSIELLDDPSIKEYFFKEQVAPSTFFKKAELEMYGDRFLRIVVIAIQNTAKAHVAKREAEKTTKDALSVTIPAQDTANAAGDDIESAPPARQEHVIQAESERLAPSRRATLTAMDTPPIELNPTSPANVPMQHANISQAPAAAPPSKDNPPQSRKRGNSTAKRFNNRGGHFQPYQPHQYPSTDHDPHPFLLPAYAPPPIVQGPPRGAGMEYMSAVPQGQPPMNMPGTMPYIPGHFDQRGFIAPHGMQHPPGFPAGEAVWFNRNEPLPELANARFPERDFNLEHRSFSNDGPNTDRSGTRRPSQGQNQRGGKHRGTNSLRGRGGRGRDSFNSDDRPSFPPGFKHGQRPSNDYTGIGPGPRGRRGSFYADNWRSNSDHPQTFPPAPHMKENVVPVPLHRSSGQFQAPFEPRHFGGRFANAPRQSNPEVTTTFHTERIDSAGAYRFPDARQTLPPSGTMFMQRSPGMYCDKQTIGPECTFVKRLILFNVPASKSIDDLKKELSNFAQIESLYRMETKFPAHQTNQTNRSEYPLIFAQFESSDHARQFLESKPDVQFNGNKALRVEVAKEYWDPKHIRYQYSIPMAIQDVETVGFPRPPKGSVGRPENMHILTVLRRAEQADPASLSTSEAATDAIGDQSADTTPTPSGASTPKKAKRFNKKKKMADDLRKASLAAAVDLKQPADTRDGTIDVPLASNPTDRGSTSYAEESVPTGLESNGTGTTAMQNQRSWSIQTEVQTSQEPIFAPSDSLQTRLPGFGEFAIDPSLTVESLPSTSNDYEIANQSDSQVKNFRTFREDNTPTTEAQAEKVALPTGEHLYQDTSPIATATAEIPTKSEEENVDDSFHTASDSPGSAKLGTAHEGLDRDSIASTVIEQQVKDKSEDVSKAIDATDSDDATSPVEGVSPKTTNKAPVLHVFSEAAITISVSGCDPKPEEAEQGSTSENTSVPQTPAFITAPTAPAAAFEQSKKEEPVAEASKHEANTIKKVDKAKGPAQTQSFSLYGKKNEKKPKPGKKGTLKGTPSSSAMSETSSRAVSGATMPSVDTAAHGQRSRRTSKEVGEGLVPSKSIDSAGDSGERHLAQEEMKVGKDDAPTPQQETPSKRGKLGNLLSGFFSGGQQLQPSSRTRSNSMVSSKGWLTKPKALDRPPSIDTQLIDPVPSGTNDIDTAGQVLAPKESANASSADLSVISLPPQLDGSNTSNTSPAGDTEHVSGSTLGLGTSNVAEDRFVENGNVSKKRKKAKKTNPNSPADGPRISIEIPSEVEDKDLSEVYHFGKSSSPQHTPQGDDHVSNASSHTIGPDTPTSHFPSPQSAKKLLPRPSGTRHLMEAKQPSWKHKKRIASRTLQVVSADSDNDEGTSSRDRDTSPPANETKTVVFGPKREKIFVYVGARPRDQIVDEPEAEAEQSNDIINRLAIEDIREKRRNCMPRPSEQV